jgi:hypothetical protein
MTVLLDVWVPGAPKTKGSLDMVTRKYARENVDGSVQWRCLVAERARAWREAHGFTEPALLPVWVYASFWLPSPRGQLDTLAGTHKNAGDVDKLARNVLDALSAPRPNDEPRKYASVYVDDVQVQRLDVIKFATVDNAPMGVHVRAWEVDENHVKAIRDHLAWFRENPS